MVDEDSPETILFARLLRLARGMLRGLRVELLEGAHVIGGGGATLTTTDGGVFVKTISLMYGAERYVHFVGVGGDIDVATAVACAETLAALVESDARVDVRHDPPGASFVISCNADSELALRARIDELEGGALPGALRALLAAM